MTTKMIGIKEFRQNIAYFSKEARDKNIVFIVLKKNVPILEIRGIDEKNFALESLSSEVKRARNDVKKSKVHSQESIMKEFGLI